MADTVRSEEGLIDNPTFCISLDLELMWGLSNELESGSNYVRRILADEKKCRGATDFLLNVFEKYNIPATWAVVGHLFLDHCKKENGIAHKGMPRFKENSYSCDPCTDIHRDPLYYGKDIVEKIMSSPVRHEIGLHSFSHVPFSECTEEVAEAEVSEGVKLAAELGITPKSFVFPWHKTGHLDVLKKHGFQIYRGNDPTQVTGQKSFAGKIKAAIMRRMLPPLDRSRWDGIWGLTTHMLFYESQIPLLSFTLLPRAKAGVRRAIRKSGIFHVYLHPHDLVVCPSIGNSLDKLLSFVAQKKERGEIQVATMGEIASYLNQKREAQWRGRGL